MLKCSLFTNNLLFFIQLVWESFVFHQNTKPVLKPRNVDWLLYSEVSIGRVADHCELLCYSLTFIIVTAEHSIEVIL